MLHEIHWNSLNKTPICRCYFSTQTGKDIDSVFLPQTWHCITLHLCQHCKHWHSNGSWGLLFSLTDFQKPSQSLSAQLVISCLGLPPCKSCNPCKTLEKEKDFVCRTFILENVYFILATGFSIQRLIKRPSGNVGNIGITAIALFHVVLVV